MNISRIFVTILFALSLTAAPPLPQTLATTDQPVIHFGAIPRYNPIIMYRSYQPIMDYLSANTPYHFELKLSRNYHQAVEFLSDGTTPVASLGDVTFAEAHLSFGAVPILKPLNAERQAQYHSIIIVRDNCFILSLDDLKGARFAFGDYHSTSGNLIPHHHLQRHGIALSDLGSYAHLESHDAVAKAVLKGTVDAGAVKDVVAYRYREHGLRFLSVSDPIPSVPIVVRKDAPEELVAALKTALLAIDPDDPRTSQELITWDPEFANGFTTATTDDYQMIFDLTRNNKNGCGLGCH
ncbi:MAG: phosphate/phosphite/phosphonate ABC transporter substrate-binding protein [Pelovirga sp.]